MSMDEQGQSLEKQSAQIKDLKERILNASFILADWDGYYDPNTKTGNTEKLAELVEEAFRALQGRSWRDPPKDRSCQNTGT
jgi:hypothetical protein